MVAGNQIYFSLSQILSTSIFKNIILENDSQSFRKRVDTYLQVLNLSSDYTNLQAIQSIYQCLRLNYRNEYFYKNSLFDDLVKKKKLKDTVVLNELRINKSIADTVFINGKAIVYEIKTELDRPEKLLGQIEDYQKAFSKVYVVTHHTVFYPYYQLIKNTGVGLLCLDEEGQLIERRVAQEISDYFDYTVLFKLLRKHEYTAIIEEQLGVIPNVPNTQHFKTCLRLVNEIPVYQFQNLVRLKLKDRSNEDQVKFATQLTPQELRYICYTSNLKSSQYSNLADFLDHSVNV